MYINVDEKTLDYVLTKMYDSTDFEALKRFWDWNKGAKGSLKTLIKNLNTASTAGSIGITNKNNVVVRSFDKLFTSADVNTQINVLANAWGNTYPSPEMLSVTGPDGKMMFP